MTYRPLGWRQRIDTVQVKDQIHRATLSRGGQVDRLMMLAGCQDYGAHNLPGLQSPISQIDLRLNRRKTLVELEYYSFLSRHGHFDCLMQHNQPWKFSSLYARLWCFLKYSGIS